MAKAKASNTRSTKIAPTVMAAALQQAGLSDPANQDAVTIAAMQSGQSSSVTAQPKTDKVAVTRDWSGQGYRDAAIVDAASTEAGRSILNVLIGLSIFKGEGFGSGKKFGPQAETYFDGWTKYRNGLPEKRQRSMNPRISEARRVLNAYLTMPRDKVDNILTGKDESAKDLSWHQRLALLPKRTAGGQGETKNPVTPNVATVASVQDATQRINMVAKFTPKEIGEMTTGLTVDQLPAALHAIGIKCQTVKEYKVLGDSIMTYLAKQEQKAEAQSKAA